MEGWQWGVGGAQKQLEGTEVGPGPAGQGHSGETHNAAGSGWGRGLRSGTSCPPLGSEGPVGVLSAVASQLLTEP